MRRHDNVPPTGSRYLRLVHMGEHKHRIQVVGTSVVICDSVVDRSTIGGDEFDSQKKKVEKYFLKVKG